uniref:Uncharacterized protein n=1 Tax=Physcomitrium patens TaxID=3218 RepID=A0A7I4ABK3_PHYPA
MSALYAAGSPYTWPGLLAALVWLIHLLLHQEATESVVTFETQWHKQAAEKKLEARKGDLVDKKAEKTVIQADIEELHNRIASQEINPADIDRMQKEKDFLDANTRPVVLKDQQLRKAAWDHELASTNKEKDLEILCGEYNERCLRFKPILADGQPLTGSELQITLQIESTVPKEILGTSVANGLKQEVYAYKAARQEKLDLLSRLVATIKKSEALHKASKEKWDLACAVVTNEREELEAKVVAKELAAKRTDKDAEKLTKQWEQRYKAEVESSSEQVATAKKQWIEVVDFILSAKEQITGLLQVLKSKTHVEAGRLKRDLPEFTAMIALQVCDAQATLSDQHTQTCYLKTSRGL